MNSVKTAKKQKKNLKHNQFLSAPGLPTLSAVNWKGMNSELQEANWEPQAEILKVIGACPFQVLPRKGLSVGC